MAAADRSQQLDGIRKTIDATQKQVDAMLQPASVTAATKKWNAFSVSVRQDFLKRAQRAVIASVQTTVPRKQWAQWETTLKFCLDDVFKRSQVVSEKAWGKEMEGLLREAGKSDDAFSKRVDEMFAELKVGQVPGFNPGDVLHRDTLVALRRLYGLQWSAYVISKLCVADA